MAERAYVNLFCYLDPEFIAQLDADIQQAKEAAVASKRRAAEQRALEKRQVSQRRWHDRRSSALFSVTNYDENGRVLARFVDYNHDYDWFSPAMFENSPLFRKVN